MENKTWRPVSGPSGNFLKRIIDLTDRGVIVPGVTAKVHVYHDEDCAFYSGKDCDCDCIVEVEQVN